MKNDSCIFCKLANGDIKTNIVYEDETFTAILDASPVANGHTLIIPKNHCKNLLDLPQNEASKLMMTAQKIAKAMMEELNLDGINLIQNNGEAAGQSVFHFHLHLIPRKANDNLNCFPTPGTLDQTWADNYLKAMKEKLAK